MPLVRTRKSKDNFIDYLGMKIVQTIAFISSVSFIMLFLQRREVILMIIAGILTFITIWSLEK